MSKVTLTFNLPEEHEEYEITMKANNYAAVIWELDQTHLRGATKYESIPDTVMREVLSDYSPKHTYGGTEEEISAAREKDQKMTEFIHSAEGRAFICSVLGGVRSLLYELTNEHECTQ